MTTAGPAYSAAACPLMTKMPLPMMEPTPIMVRSMDVRHFLNPASGSVGKPPFPPLSVSGLGIGAGEFAPMQPETWIQTLPQTDLPGENASYSPSGQSV